MAVSSASAWTAWTLDSQRLRRSGLERPNLSQAGKGLNNGSAWPRADWGSWTSDNPPDSATILARKGFASM